jgi:hypothetical protein
MASVLRPVSDRIQQNPVGAEFDPTRCQRFRSSTTCTVNLGKHDISKSFERIKGPGGPLTVRVRSPSGVAPSSSSPLRCSKFSEGREEELVHLVTQLGQRRGAGETR